ncbi:MAG TPA: hypothetical protein VLH10_14600 [Yinghuangia sp.]|uniref:hypothetical protein n=1 Tax=Yinghuangia sp. YIM S10712 TaxID=3436930 RepID=UPI002C4B8701|nr:hypothetical protein [Yinghuangia sp.]
MRDNVATWARAAFVVPFIAAMAILVMFACDVPGSDSGASHGPTATPDSSAADVQSPESAVIVTTPPTGAPPPDATDPDELPLPEGSATLPMDGQTADVDAPAEEAPALAPPVPEQVDFQDPVAVSRAAVVVMWTSDTTKDSRPGDAMLRAEPYLSQELNEAARTAQSIERLPPDWVEMSERQGRTVVTATLADEKGKPPDTPTEAYHAWSLTVSPIGADGWRGVPENITVFVTLARSMVGQPWQVTNYQLS